MRIGCIPSRRAILQNARPTALDCAHSSPGRARARCQGFQTLEEGPTGFSPGRANESHPIPGPHAARLSSRSPWQTGSGSRTIVRPAGRGCGGGARPGFENPGNARVRSGQGSESGPALRGRCPARTTQHRRGQCRGQREGAAISGPRPKNRHPIWDAPRHLGSGPQQYRAMPCSVILPPRARIGAFRVDV